MTIRTHLIEFPIDFSAANCSFLDQKSINISQFSVRFLHHIGTFFRHIQRTFLSHLRNISFFATSVSRPLVAISKENSQNVAAKNKIFLQWNQNVGAIPSQNRLDLMPKSCQNCSKNNVFLIKNWTSIGPKYAPFFFQIWSGFHP